MGKGLWGSLLPTPSPTIPKGRLLRVQSAEADSLRVWPAGIWSNIFSLNLLDAWYDLTSSGDTWRQHILGQDQDPGKEPGSEAASPSDAAGSGWEHNQDQAGPGISKPVTGPTFISLGSEVPPPSGPLMARGLVMQPGTALAQTFKRLLDEPTILPAQLQLPSGASRCIRTTVPRKTSPPGQVRASAMCLQVTSDLPQVEMDHGWGYQGSWGSQHPLLGAWLGKGLAKGSDDMPQDRHRGKKGM